MEGVITYSNFIDSRLSDTIAKLKSAIVECTENDLTYIKSQVVDLKNYVLIHSVDLANPADARTLIEFIGVIDKNLQSLNVYEKMKRTLVNTIAELESKKKSLIDDSNALMEFVKSIESINTGSELFKHAILATVVRNSTSHMESWYIFRAVDALYDPAHNGLMLTMLIGVNEKRLTFRKFVMNINKYAKSNKRLATLKRMYLIDFLENIFRVILALGGILLFFAQL